MGTALVCDMHGRGSADPVILHLRAATLVTWNGACTSVAARVRCLAHACTDFSTAGLSRQVCVPSPWRS